MHLLFVDLSHALVWKFSEVTERVPFTLPSSVCGMVLGMGEIGHKWFLNEWMNQLTESPLSFAGYLVSYETAAWKTGRGRTCVTFSLREVGASCSSALSFAVMAPQRRLFLELLFSCSRLNYVASFHSYKTIEIDAIPMRFFSLGIKPAFWNMKPWDSHVERKKPQNTVISSHESLRGDICCWVINFGIGKITSKI